MLYYSSVVNIIAIFPTTGLEMSFLIWIEAIMYYMIEIPLAVMEYPNMNWSCSVLMFANRFLRYLVLSMPMAQACLDLDSALCFGLVRMWDFFCDPSLLYCNNQFIECFFQCHMSVCVSIRQSLFRLSW